MAKHAKGADRLIGIGFLVATLLLGIGISLPVMTVTKLFIFTGEKSIVGVVINLAHDREYLLTFIVLAFSVVLPVTKNGVAYVLWRNVDFNSDAHAMGLRILNSVSKWSVADVLVVALCIVIAQSTGMASARSAPGLYFFVASILLTSVLLARLKFVCNRAGEAK